MRRDERVIPLGLTDVEEVDPGAYLRSVVRVFPDSAGTVLWFVGGPLRAEDAAITDELAVALAAWEASYDGALDGDLHWRSPEEETRHHREGLRLARELSDELGDAFEVEVFGLDAEHGEHRIRIRSVGDPTNPPAVAALRALAADDARVEAEVRDARRRGGSFGWTAYAPSSDRTHK